MTIIISSITYRLVVDKEFPDKYYCLQGYSSNYNKWVDMFQFNRPQVRRAKTRYGETMRLEPCHQSHYHFSITNLFELSNINNINPQPQITKMLADVCNILDIELEFT